MRSAATNDESRWPWKASTIPSSGARSQRVPSSVEPFSAGNAESPTIAIAT